MKRIIPAAIIAAAMPLAAGAEVLKASHQFPGGKGDARDEMVQMIARDVAEADVDLEIRVYPGESLYKAKEQWSAVTSGQLDMTSFPLDYAAGRVPQFSVTLMPGLVRNHERARRLNDSPFMEDLHKMIEDAGAVVLSDAWLSGGFVSKQNCITGPDTISGQVTRAAGPAFEQMLVAAGASISSMPSSEIYTGMQTGVLDAANTSSGSMVSYRLFEQGKCLTAPGDNALWFMYEPVLISKKKFERLDEAQQKALIDAGKRAEDWFAEQAAGLDSKMVETFTEAGVEVVEMSQDDFDAWLTIARETSYKNFADEIEGGQDLIDKAMAVE
ncbi:TRAP transporter substrate-binding protein [Paracoccus onubensis]|uniref:ABC transporter substrate-binding protein n=1 Tax=Paracoccus onubensis TaxID=1675788 RepID=A0A418SXM7_9RHOB|nr:TRAP transporter substrate-binding protein DctP [Paracoccus onubensis]RJE85722.1 ABC transporter substrate-binding protein [Paracoccus onubensis]